MLINKLKQESEMDPNKHDGSYKLVEEVVKALKKIDNTSIGIEDLDMLYFMTVGTWTSSFDNKKNIVEKSNLLEKDKKYIVGLIDRLREDAKKGKYENIEGEASIGMFGSGFGTFGAFNTRLEDAQVFIQLCTEIYDMEDENQILEVVDYCLKNQLTGLKTAVASLSQILHCIKPFIFPILNKGENTGIDGYRRLGVKLNQPGKIYYFIDNVKRIRDFRNDNFNFKNYRIIDKFLLENKDLYKDGPRKDSRNKVAEDSGRSYWWLNANPKIWSFSNKDIGEEGSYTLYNEKGNKRRIFKNFQEVKAGDYVIGYESNPMKKIVALLHISKGNDGERIYFKKDEDLLSPIEYDLLNQYEELENMEFLRNSNGSLFKLTKDEYEFIMELVRKENPLTIRDEKMPYKMEDFLDQVYMTAENAETLLSLLRNKKNIIIQGAPGVGKTYAANRLAYVMMGQIDESRVKQVQFHQNYSYENFVMGYRPKGEGFELRDGIFLEFCRKAERDLERPYFFIIDEINRGNISKIFGELLMLIENSYRGKNINLSYNNEPFNVPENIHIIGMMNTADRSLAMIDYALRRRFSFFEMEPGFDSDGFKSYQEDLNSETLDRLIDKIKLLNIEIRNDDSLGDGFCIGHSYFCNQEIFTKDWLKEVVEFDILPTLKEYWFDDTEKLKRWKDNLRGVLND